MVENKYYERKIKYLDLMENGERAGGAGFIKTEVKGMDINLTIAVKGLHPTDTYERDVMLQAGDGEFVVGRIVLKEGQGEFKYHTVMEHSQLQGVRISLGGAREICCKWQEEKRSFAVKENPVRENAAQDKEMSGNVVEGKEEEKQSRTKKLREIQLIPWDEIKVVEESLERVEKIMSKPEENGTWKAAERAVLRNTEREMAAERTIERDRTGETAAGERMSEETAVRERRTGETAARERMSEETAVRERRMGETSARERMSEETAAGEKRMGETSARERVSEETAAGEKRTGEKRTGETSARERVSEETAVGEKRMGETAARERVSEETAVRERRMGKTAVREKMAGNRMEKQGRAGEYPTGKGRRELNMGNTTSGRSAERRTEKSEKRTLSDRPLGREKKPVRLMEDKWQQIWAIYPHIHPFQDEREYLSISPADFVLLPDEAYRAANNSFLLHGYYNYDHLILTRIEKRGEVSYYIGVPGNYYEREKQVAIMFGFESFECGTEPAQAGDFGYYMMRTRL